MRKLHAENLEDRRLLAVVTDIDNFNADYAGDQIDTYIQGGLSAGSNFGGADDLRSRDASPEQQTLVQFSRVFHNSGGVAHVPPNDSPDSAGAERTVINDATLRLNFEPNFHGAGWQAFLLTETFVEGSATWNNPLTINDGAVGITEGDVELGPFSCSDGGSALSCDVTEAMQYAVDGHHNSSLFSMTFAITSSLPTRLASRESGVQPSLIVSYDRVDWANVNQDGVTNDFDIDWMFDLVQEIEPYDIYADFDGDGDNDDDDLDTLILVLLDTYYGDANLDGQVDASGDGAILLNNLSGGSRPQGSKLWRDGDFNGDGFVNASDDGGILLANLGNGT